MSRSPWRSVAALAMASSCAMTCAEVLGVDATFEGITEQFCKCNELDERWPKDFDASEFYTCEEYVNAAINSGSAEARAWIDSFEERGCTDCSKAVACTQAPPLCIPLGSGPCAVDSSCCGYDEKHPTASYCGYVLDEAGEETIDRVCVADENPDSCASEGQACSEDSQCCGSAGSLARCHPVAGFCFGQCDPDNPILCPDCCAFVAFFDQLGVPGPEAALCVGGLPYDPDAPRVACDQTCLESCPLGFGCGRVEHRLEFDDVDGKPRFSIITVTECIDLSQPN